MCIICVPPPQGLATLRSRITNEIKLCQNETTRESSYHSQRSRRAFYQNTNLLNEEKKENDGSYVHSAMCTLRRQTEEVLRLQLQFVNFLGTT